MDGVKTLATLVLGGAFDATELSDNDIVIDTKLADELQQQLVTGFDDVHIELVSRNDFDAALAREAALVETIRELSDRVVAGDGREAALREELAKVTREKNDIAYRCADSEEKLRSMTISKATMRNKLKQRQAAAEQRNAALTELLTGLPEGLKELSGCENTAGVQACIEYVEYCIGQIKPTESGASE